MAYDEESKGARFNAGVAFAERIDSLQRAINAARFNPLAMNGGTGTMNYEVMISSNDGLLNECWAKLTSDEQKVANRIRSAVKLFVELNPILLKNSNGIKLNKQNYKKMMELLDLYEKLNKKFLEAHDLNNPNREDDEGL